MAPSGDAHGPAGSQADARGHAGSQADAHGPAGSQADAHGPAGSQADAHGPAGSRASTAPDDEVGRMLEDRYGTRQRRLWVPISIGIAAAAFVAFLAWATFVGSVAPVRADVLTFTMDSDERTQVEISVRTRPGLAGPFTCVVRAQGDRRVDVGYVLLDIAPTDGREETVAYSLRTRALARVVQVLGCFEGRTPPAAIPAPQFPPGVRPPAQEPPGRAP